MNLKYLTRQNRRETDREQRPKQVINYYPISHLNMLSLSALSRKDPSNETFNEVKRLYFNYCGRHPYDCPLNNVVF